MRPFPTFIFYGALCGLIGCGPLVRDVPNSAPDVANSAGPSNGPTNGAAGAIANIFGRSPETSAVSTAGGADAATLAVTDAVLTDDTAALTVPAVSERPERNQFFGLLGGFGASPSSDGIETVAVPPSGVLSYGDIARVCGLSARNLGRELDSKSGYTVYDTVPSTTSQRTHFITGFSDGCARQFTAALVFFGDIGTHEIVRYGAADGGLEYTETDNAYEQIKADFCGVRAGQPCGSRLERLAQRTTFLTLYQRFGSNPVWADILLHDGQVVAMDFKGI